MSPLHPCTTPTLPLADWAKSFPSAAHPLPLSLFCRLILQRHSPVASRRSPAVLLQTELAKTLPERLKQMLAAGGGSISAVRRAVGSKAISRRGTAGGALGNAEVDLAQPLL